MPNVSRIGDVFTGVCHCHKHPKHVTGVIVSGAPTVIGCGSGVARIGDVVVCSCGHVAVIVSGSPTVISNGSSTARIGDVATGCPIGTLVSGCPTLIAG